MMKTPKHIEKSITVTLDQDEAFDLFTANLDKWWPATKDGATITLDPGFGGTLKRTGPEDDTEILGRITHFEPGESLTFTWQKGDEVIELLLTFTQIEDGTRVDLVELPLALADAVAACKWIPDPEEILLAFKACARPVMA